MKKGRAAAGIGALLVLLGSWTPAASAQQVRGPEYCRSGAGHPEHGRAWCVLNGYRVGGGSASVWNEAQWEDVVLRVIRRDRHLPRTALGEVIGAVALDRLEQQRRRLNLGAALSGRWLSAERGGVILQVYAGRTPLAELADLDGNGRVDLVLLNAGQRQDEPRYTER